MILEPSFERMTRGVVEDPGAPGIVYGYGVKWAGSDRRLGHSGGMVGFTANLMVDVVSGVGVTILMNSAFGSPLDLVEFSIACLAAEAAGEPMPEIPPEPERAPRKPVAPGDGRGPRGWEALAGRYRSWNPWAPILHVAERGGRLWASLIGDPLGWGDEERELVPLPDGRYRLGEDWSPDRLRFEAFVNGRAVRAVLDGAPFTRVVA